ncbi:MAG: flagellin [Candidatus Nitrospinota bacterium M3_3B_026]
MPIQPLNAGSQSALIGIRHIGDAQNRIGQNLSRLASGMRINRAADDAAGLAISEQLIADIRSAEQAGRNIADAGGMLRVAEGGLTQISDLLARGRELSIQAASGTVGDEQRALLQNEIESIQAEVTRITNVTEFNGTKPLAGDLAPGAVEQVEVQAGIQNTPEDRVNLNVVEATDAAALGIAGVDISTQAGARDALSQFDTAIERVTQRRARIGATQNRLQAAAANLGVQRENLAAANTAIRGLDYARETSAFARNQALGAAGISALRQGQQSQAGIIGSLLDITG